jgi:hypothetical protein
VSEDAVDTPCYDDLDLFAQVGLPGFMGLLDKSAPTERLITSPDRLMKEDFSRLEAARLKSTH